MDHAKHYAKGWIKHVLAYLIGAGLLAGMIYFINDSARTEALSGILKLWTVIIGIDFLITASYFIWPKKRKLRRISGVNMMEKVLPQWKGPFSVL